MVVVMKEIANNEAIAKCLINNEIEIRVLINRTNKSEITYIINRNWPTD